LGHEPLLTGFIERRIGFIFIFLFEKLGEVPLVEGSFRSLIEVGLPPGISSLDDENLHVLESILLLFLIDLGILSDFVTRNNQELKERSNYGKLKKFN